MNRTSTEKFNATWEPRIGVEATELLRKRMPLVALAISPFLVALLLSTLLHPPLFFIVTALYAIVAGFVYRWAFLRLNRRLTVALSKHLGVAITEKNLGPLLRSGKRFETAVAKLREAAA